MPDTTIISVVHETMGSAAVEPSNCHLRLRSLGNRLHGGVIMYRGLLFKKPGYDLQPRETPRPNTPQNPYAGWRHWAEQPQTKPAPKPVREGPGLFLTDPDQQFEEPAAFGTHYGVVP